MDLPYKKSLTFRARELRKQATREENHLWYDFLKTYPVPFRRQHPIGNYIVDFYCYQAKLVIELDGSQHTDPDQFEYDCRRTAYLESNGLSVIRISNRDIWANFRGVCEYIDTYIKSRVQ